MKETFTTLMTGEEIKVAGRDGRMHRVWVRQVPVKEYPELLRVLDDEVGQVRVYCKVLNPDAEAREQNIQQPTSNLEHPKGNLEPRTSNLEPRTLEWEAVRAGISGMCVASNVGGTNYWVIDIGGGSWQTNHIP